MATELFTRWFQYGVFTSPDVHGPRDSRLRPAATQGVLTDYLHLRDRLQPYRLSFAREAEGTHATPLPPPPDFRRLMRDSDAGRQFMFGPSLLVSPVTAPGATSRIVELPARSAWIDFWTGTSCPGGQRIHAPAPLRIIPLFVKAGAILPLAPVPETIGTGSAAGPVELRVYPGANGRFLLHEYEDLGDLGSPPAPRASIPIRWHEASRVLKIGARQEALPGPRGTLSFRIVFVRPRHGVGIPDTAVADQVVTYTGAAVKIRQNAFPPPEAASSGFNPAPAAAESFFQTRYATTAPRMDPASPGPRWLQPAPGRSPATISL